MKSRETISRNGTHECDGSPISTRPEPNKQSNLNEYAFETTLVGREMSQNQNSLEIVDRMVDPY
jgi:hypothetical protein